MTDVGTITGEKICGGNSQCLLVFLRSKNCLVDLLLALLKAGFLISLLVLKVNLLKDQKKTMLKEPILLGEATRFNPKY